MSDLSNKDIARLVAVKAKPVFDQEGWTWCDTKGKPPTAERIEETVERLLKTLDEVAVNVDNPDRTVGSGRFILRRQFVDDAIDTSVTLDLYSQTDY